MDEAEFKRICLDGGGLRPLSTFIERKRRAKTARDLADKHIRTARTLLHDGEEGHFVVHHAYFAMEHKANEWLAVSGHSSKNHICTQVALGRPLQRRDMAATLSRAYQDRLTYDHTSDPESMVTATTREGFLEIAKGFVGTIAGILEQNVKQAYPPNVDASGDIP